MDESTWTRHSSKVPRRGALPRAALAAAWLALPGPAWAQQAPEEAKGETPKEAAAAPQPAAPVISAGPEGFSLASADKQFQLKLRGYAQADGRLFTRGRERPGANAFLIRRARPLIEGTLFGLVDFRLLPDFAAGAPLLQDAYLDIHPVREVRLRAGKFKEPFGLERLQSATSLLFVERALPTNLVPNRDVGLQLHGEILGGVLTYAVGAFNGVPDGGSTDLNLDDNVDLVGRLFAHPFRRTGLRPLQGLGLGFAASRGSQHGTQQSTGEAPFRTAGQQVFFSYLTGATLADTVVADGEHIRLSPQGYYFWGPFGLLAEYVSSTHEVRRGPEQARLRSEAWQAAASFVLFGANASFEGVRPARPLKPSEGSWGAVELAARYSELRIDPEAFPRFADPDRSARVAKGWGAGANWYLSGNTRVSFQLERTTFEGGGAGGGDRTPELVLLNRFQVSW
ncbi:OprO/OprP family phosphate-selective porin [Archangium sp.]|uniref:OprO/OprP family phosphate-selective porin n=1 Tax=Archangium sp. TaxID=1872627 RepID=UPI002D33DE7C|nr:porin [Archangium sp.]HYO58556.1 porin [Archangium sp.]